MKEDSSFCEQKEAKRLHLFAPGALMGQGANSPNAIRATPVSEQTRFSLTNRVSSFINAGRVIPVFPRSTHNAWAQLLILAIAISAIGGCAWRDDMTITDVRCTVARVAERWVAKNYPDYDTIKNLPIVTDQGSHWLVGYNVGYMVFGGSPTVEIDKETLRVLRGYHTADLSTPRSVDFCRC